MFIFNVNLNKSKYTKFVMYAFIIIIISLIFLFRYLLNTKTTYVNDSINPSEISEITPENYTSILKTTTDNLDMYVGQKIKFTGFVHRLYDFNNNQFVLGREMIYNQTSDNTAEAVIVGFLCEYENASSYAQGTWVEIEGVISKGFYHSEIPVIKVTSFKKSQCPSNPFVNPPDDNFLPTSTL